MPQYSVKNQKELGAVIQHARESQGTPQYELAGSLGLSRQYLMYLERGKPTLYISRLFRILSKLGITVSVSWSDKNEDKAEVGS